jgi:hypothetical protein
VLVAGRQQSCRPQQGCGAGVHEGDELVVSTGHGLSSV